MRKPKWELIPTKEGRYAYNLKAANGEIILSGIECPSKADAVATIAIAMKAGPHDMNYITHNSLHGEFYFQLYNGLEPDHVLGYSQMYQAKQAMQVGIAAVKKGVSFGRIVEP